MQQAEQERKLKLKAKSIVKNMQKPKVKEPEVPKEPSEEEILSYKFKANPVPKSVYTPVFHLIQEKEKLRKVLFLLLSLMLNSIQQRIEEKAKELLQQSSAPNVVSHKPQKKQSK